MSHVPHQSTLLSFGGTAKSLYVSTDHADQLKGTRLTGMH